MPSRDSPDSDTDADALSEWSVFEEPMQDSDPGALVFKGADEQGRPCCVTYMGWTFDNEIQQSESRIVEKWTASTRNDALSWAELCEKVCLFSTERWAEYQLDEKTRLKDGEGYTLAFTGEDLAQIEGSMWVDMGTGDFVPAHVMRMITGLASGDLTQLTLRFLKDGREYGGKFTQQLDDVTTVQPLWSVENAQKRRADWNYLRSRLALAMMGETAATET